jgi:hypothetical protein
VEKDTTTINKEFKTIICKLSNQYQKLESYRLLGDSYRQAGDTTISSNYGCSIAVDTAGDIYLAGVAFSGFPVTPGAYFNATASSIKGQTQSSGGNIFVCKLNFKCDNMAFSYPNFEKAENFNYVGSAKKEGANILLTPSKSWQSGAVWTSDKVPVMNGFKAEFSFRVSNGLNTKEKEDYPGADGITFVIQNDAPDVVGDNGGGIGYSGIKNCLAVEFDTYRNYDQDASPYSINDPDGNHIGVFCNGKNGVTSIHDTNCNIATYAGIMPIIPDGRKYYAKIEYMATFRTLQVYFDSTEKFNTPVNLSMTSLDLSKFIDLDNEGKAWVGFTSATGIVFEKHELLSWTLCPGTVYLPIVDVDENIQNNKDLLLFPNPANDILTINNLNELSSVNSVEIYDILGNRVMEFTNEGNLFFPLKIDVKNLNTGMYYIVLVKDNNIIRENFSIVR